MGFAVSLLACAARDSEVVAAPITPVVVVIPTLEEEQAADGARQAAGESAAPLGPCPQGTFLDHGRCMRIVASEEIPTWTAPTGHLDPCATLTSDNAVYGCDPQRENADDDAGAGSHPSRRAVP